MQWSNFAAWPKSLQVATFAIPIPLFVVLAFALPSYRSRFKRRKNLVFPESERVLILGATSGIGEAIAHIYAGRDAKVCLVGRRQQLVDDVVRDCNALSKNNKCVGARADFTSVEDMVRLREFLESEWKGVDTLVVAAGVSALQPLMALTDIDLQKGIVAPTTVGIHKAIDITAKATAGNYVGPVIAALTFVPILEQTSAKPAIMLISSAAALIPAPTRTLYGSTKAAALILYQSLSIEHPLISFTNVIPGTVEGNFRASAVDAGPVREADPNKFGLKRGYVARMSIDAVDNGKKNVILGSGYALGHFLYWIFPGFVERLARKKYNFP